MQNDIVEAKVAQAAALASCTTQTLQLYVRHKGWSVGRIGVAVTHQHVGGVFRLECRIEVDADLAAEHRAAILRVAQACPIYKTLTGDIVIDTRLD